MSFLLTSWQGAADTMSTTGTQIHKLVVFIFCVFATQTPSCFSHFFSNASRCFVVSYDTYIGIHDTTSQSFRPI